MIAKFKLLASTAILVLGSSLANGHSVDQSTNVTSPRPGTASTSNDLPSVVEGVVDQFKLWQTGSTIRACFFQGSRAVRAKFIDASKLWLSYANLNIDFGAGPSFRNCTTEGASQLRVAFKPDGNWSYVGTDSIRGDLARASLNIQNGNSMGDKVTDPVQFRATVLHEVGHFLALQHEHQSPEANCDNEFDWDAIYKEFQARDGWDRNKVDHNMRTLVASRRLRTTEYDPKSIMHYYFAAWMFKDGVNSSCYVGRNTDLSELDKAAIAAAYPQSPAEQLNLVNRRLASTQKLIADANLTPEMKDEIRSQIKESVTDSFPQANVSIVTGDKSPVLKDVDTKGGDIKIDIQ